MKKLWVVCLLLLLSLTSALSQTQTVGVFTHITGSKDDGYVLYAPFDQSDTTYLIDKCGKLIHKWPSQYTPGADAYLLPDGSILRAGHIANTFFDACYCGTGGIIERIDWDGNVVWHYVISDTVQVQSHDICYLPNGNILVDVWEDISKTAALAAGRKTFLLGSSLYMPKVVELKPIGTDSAEVVWTWRLMDHLVQDYTSTKANFGVVADHPELVNFNYIYALEPMMGLDWTHMNAVTYNPDLDQVMISAHNQNEVWIIDHSTTTAEAASHTGGKYGKGGDLLYRWGNPAAYNRPSSTIPRLYEQHDPTWITSGIYKNQIAVFNNGYGRPGGTYYSTIDIFQPPVDSTGNYILGSGVPYGPTTLSWSYQSPTPSDFYSQYMGSAQVLSNGNVLVCNATKGEFFEVDPLKHIVWRYINPVERGLAVAQYTPVTYNRVYKVLFYDATYSAFAGKSLDEGPSLEHNPLPNSCKLDLYTPVLHANGYATTVVPNPISNNFYIQNAEHCSYSISDITGKLLQQGNINSSNMQVNISNYNKGMYFLKIQHLDGGFEVIKLLKD